MKKKSEELLKNKTGSHHTAGMDKRTQEILRHSEEKYRAILDNIEEGYFEADLTGKFTFINDTVCRVTGYTKDELIGMDNRQYTAKEDLKDVFQAYNKVYTTGEPIKEFCWQIISRDGSKKYIAGSISLIKNLSGKPTGFRGIVRDTTERKLAEELLKNNEEQYRLLADNITENVWLLDLNSMIMTYMSPSVEKMYGFTYEEMKSLSLRELLTEESFHKMVDAFLFEMPKALATPPPSVHKYSLELEARHRDGHLLWIDNTLSFIRDENGRTAFILGETRDITERKRIEEILRESENRYRLSFENVTDVIFMIDTSLNISSISPSMERLLGYKPQEFIGRSVFDIGNMILMPESFQQAVTNINLILQGVTISSVIYGFIAKDGTMKFCELSGSPIMQKGMIIGMISVARDITDRKRAEEALKQSESWYRTIYENTGTAIITIEEDTTISLTNTEFEKLSGYSKMEIEGKKHWEEFVVQEDLERMLTQHRLRRDDANSAQKKYEFRFIDKHGAIKDVVLSIDMIPGTKKSIASLLDITERKQGEEKLRRTLDSLRKAVGTTISVMVSAIELRDPYTAGHQRRCADIATAIAMEMGLDQEIIDGISMAGIIHDIGKLSIPSEILSRPTKLTSLEFSLIKEHSRSGYEMLKDVESPWPLAEIIHQHHELMNGTGYPRNLKGDEILIEARILAVADVVEAMASHRPYRAALGIEAALEEIEKNKGILYDAAVVDACLKLFREKGYHLT